MDEGLYSRQLYVLGREAMARLGTSRVLISGLTGLGMEIAKNLILCGIQSVIVQDCHPMTNADLSSQFYLNERDLGKNRAQAAVRQLSQLNANVQVTYSSDALTTVLIQSLHIDVMVLTDARHEEKCLIGEYCHQHQIRLVIADTKGLFGQIFCDFGENFQVTDTNGETVQMHLVTNISHEENGVVSVLPYERHNLDSGSFVTFADVRGMSEVNGKEFEITGLDPYKFAIGDTTSFGNYDSGGRLIEVKKPQRINFKSFADSLIQSELPVYDFNKFDMPLHLHLAFQALSLFEQKYQAMPKPWDDADAEKFFELTSELNRKVRDEPVINELNQHWIQLFSKTCTGHLCPIDAIIGGIAAQEVIKGITGKFMPIKQFFYFDAIECLPDHAIHPPLDTLSRYHSQEIVFGEDFQQRLGNWKCLLAGAGAVGCELLKQLCMMGIGGGNDGRIYVADMDVIERSNLHRHALFRTSDIGNMKSKTAEQVVKAMDPSIHIHAFVDPIQSNTEHVYHDSFFEQLDAVLDTTDSIVTRKYIDRRCVFSRKPLITGGTLGTKANVHVTIPMLTESYSSTPDSPELSTPLDQIRNFPHRIEHAIGWARGAFLELFVESPKQANDYMQDPHSYAQRSSEINCESYQHQRNTEIQRLVGHNRPRTFADCIQWARNDFDEKFNCTIARLLKHFPPDFIASHGTRFWIEHKLCPHALQFDSSQPTHRDFIIAASSLMASIYNIPIPLDQLQSMQFDSKSDSISGDLEITKDIGSKAEEILARLPASDAWLNLKLRAHEIKLDDEFNCQLDYLVAATHLRAENYGIEMVERSEVKRITAKIAPAIVTTAAVLAGFMSLEMCKVIQGHRNIESFKESFLNMALPMFIFCELMPAKRQTYLGHHFTLWDRFEIQGEMSLEQFIEYFKKEHQLRVTLIAAGEWMIYYNLVAMQPKRAADMNRKVSEIYERISNKKIPDHVRSLILDLSCDDIDGNEIENVPSVNYAFR